MSDEEEKLKMWFPFRNVCLRECQLSCCSWGQRKIFLDNKDNIRGIY